MMMMIVGSLMMICIISIGIDSEIAMHSPALHLVVPIVCDHDNVMI
jgi:hypothetical protein